MPHTIGISFSKNHFFLAEIKQDSDIRSLHSLISFTHENNPVKAIRSNKAIFDQLISKETKIILALPSHDILLKTMMVDCCLTDSEIIQYIHSQSFTLFGFSAKALSFDYEVLFKTENHQHIIVAATHHHATFSFETVFHELKMPLHAIDVDAFALVRLHFLNDKESHTTLLFQQDDQTLIVTTQNGKVQKKEWVSIQSTNTILSSHSNCILMNANHELKKLLDEQLIAYQDIDYSLLDTMIKNKSNVCIKEMPLSLIAIGSALWGMA